MSFILTFLGCLLLVAVRGHDEEESLAVKYSAESFNLGLATNNHFVMFYAPWCGHCSRLSPTWEKLAEEFNDGSNSVLAQVIIAKVDCTVETALCSEHDVTGYPTLKFFKAGHDEGLKYRGARDYDALKSYIVEQVGKAQQEVDELQEEPKAPAPVSGLVELTEETFDNYVATGNHFVKFYAPWCGYCKKLAPTWEKLAESLHFTTNVRVSQVDCTEHKEVCQRFEVKGYPSLLWIVDGQKIEKYSGDRSIEDLKSYVSRQLGVDLVETPEEVPSISNPVVQLSKENFEHVIEKGLTFVKFFAPWCGHCKRMAPTWDELGNKFLGIGEVTIGKVDCTVDINKELCVQQEVRGYPSIYLYKDGERINSYEGNRQLEDMYLFVMKHLQQKDEL